MTCHVYVVESFVVTSQLAAGCLFPLGASKVVCTARCIDGVPGHALLYSRYYNAAKIAYPRLKMTHPLQRIQVSAHPGTFLAPECTNYVTAYEEFGCKRFNELLVL